MYQTFSSLSKPFTLYLSLTKYDSPFKTLLLWSIKRCQSSMFLCDKHHELLEHFSWAVLLIYALWLIRVLILALPSDVFLWNNFCLPVVTLASRHAARWGKRWIYEKSSTKQCSPVWTASELIAKKGIGILSNSSFHFFAINELLCLFNLWSHWVE